MIDTAAFRHGMRVRMNGVRGPRGVLLRYTKTGGEHYWRVRLQGTGEWVRPDDFVVDGPGDHIAVCAHCRLRCLTDGVTCQRCDAEASGTAVRTAERDVATSSR